MYSTALMENIRTDFDQVEQCGSSNSTGWGCSMDALKRVKYRKIMRRSDFIKILFVCVCVCHVCPAHPCGNNPMRALESFSNTNGVAPEMVLRVLELNNPDRYSSFMDDYHQYNECMRMLHTGYFKRSVDNLFSRQRKTVRLSDILSGSGGKRRHKRFGKFSSRSLRDVLSRDTYTDDIDDTQLDSWDGDDYPIVEEEVVPEQVLEESLPALLKRLYNRNQEIAVILVEPAKSDSPVSRSSRRQRRRRRHR